MAEEVRPVLTLEEWARFNRGRRWWHRVLLAGMVLVGVAAFWTSLWSWAVLFVSVVADYLWTWRRARRLPAPPPGR